MVWRPRPLRSATFAAVTVCALAAACGASDQKTDAPSRSNTGGSTGGTGGSTGGTGGDSSTASTCSYNGVHYENGDVFGECGECICAEGGVFCTDIACPPAAAGGGGSQAGGRSNGGTSTGMSTGGSVGIPAGAHAGGTAGIDTSPGGAGGEAGGVECPVVPLTKFCVIGNPASDGLVSLPNHAKLSLELYPTDCSCSRILSAACSTFRSGVTLEVNRDICLEPDGNDCHDPCTASQIVHCDTGVTLGASSSDIRIELAGTELFVSLKVPSVVPAEDLCATVP
jgi:hypothetical protein